IKHGAFRFEARGDPRGDGSPGSVPVRRVERRTARGHRTWPADSGAVIRYTTGRTPGGTPSHPSGPAARGSRRAATVADGEEGGTGMVAGGGEGTGVPARSDWRVRASGFLRAYCAP